MSDSSASSPNRAIDDRTIRGMKPARSREDRRRRERLQVLVVCLVMLTALGLGLMLATTTGLPTAFRSPGVSDRDNRNSNSQARNSSEGGGAGEEEGAKFGSQLRSGTIVPMNLRDPCMQLNFNNDTGRVSESAKPCKNEVVLDARGVPVPQGTINRMDALKRAFSKDR